MIITLCFLSGDLQELEVGPDISRVHNVKAIISEELYLKDGTDCDPDLIHLYKDTTELEDDEMVVDGEMYRVVICVLHKYIIYAKNDKVYCKETDGDEEYELSDYELGELIQNSTKQYYFDVKSFHRNKNILYRHGFAVSEEEENDIYIYENEYSYTSSYYNSEYYTVECLKKIFRGIGKLNFISELKSDE